MLEKTSFFTDLEITAKKVKAARSERSHLLSIANEAWHQYQKFVDEDPRWKNPNCSQTELKKFQIQLDQMRINAELADLAAKNAYQKLGNLDAQFLQILGRVS
ncbi:MAG: hypothetical protein ACYDH1_01610 [Anaerolineaceae bacterium]